MAGAINWTRQAERWLRDIYDYIAADDPAAAARVVQGIYDRAKILAEHPDIGYRHETRRNRPVRVLLYGHYRIAYIVKSDDDIDILGVFHGAMQINRYLIGN